ncbi:MAG: polyprenyl synthetase family protein, partial [Caulobacteraceae bacterium]|nr:polyprenyl synthetase family protein [Caulobacter sp.]
IEDVLRLAQVQADEAKRALSACPGGAWRDALSELADFAVSRRA